MTWTQSTPTPHGLLGVLVVVAVLTLIFNQRQTQAHSLTATVATDTYDVGAPYGGTVIEQFVEGGRRRRRRARSSSHHRASRSSRTSPTASASTNTEAYDVDPKDRAPSPTRPPSPARSTELAARQRATWPPVAFARISVARLAVTCEAKFLLSPARLRAGRGGAAVTDPAAEQPDRRGPTVHHRGRHRAGQGRHRGPGRQPRDGRRPRHPDQDRHPGRRDPAAARRRPAGRRQRRGVRLFCRQIGLK